MDSVNGEFPDTILRESNEVLYYGEVNNGATLDPITRDELLRDMQLHDPDFMFQLDRAANYYLLNKKDLPFMDEESRIKFAFIDGALLSPALQTRKDSITTLEQQLQVAPDKINKNSSKIYKSLSKFFAYLGIVKISNI